VVNKTLYLLPPIFHPLAGLDEAIDRALATRRRAAAELVAAHPGEGRAELLDVELRVATLDDLETQLPLECRKVLLLPGGSQRVRAALLHVVTEIGIPMVDVELPGDRTASRDRWREPALAPPFAGGTTTPGLRSLLAQVAERGGLDARAALLTAACGGLELEDLFLQESLSWTHPRMFQNLRGGGEENA
jgi:LSD1 subclass zinc finger protein